MVGHSCSLGVFLVYVWVYSRFSPHNPKTCFIAAGIGSSNLNMKGSAGSEDGWMDEIVGIYSL